MATRSEDIAVNEPSDEKQKRKRFRLRLQFSLRTLLLLTLVAAIVCAWMLRPKSEELLFSDGALRIRAQVVHNEACKDKTCPVPVRPTLNGRWKLVDRNGRRLVTGYYEDESPVRRWTYYHANGRKAFYGDVTHAARQGDWTARFANGKVRSQTTETPVEHTHLKSGLFAKTTKVTLWSPLRDGPAEQYWETGHLRANGEYVQDLREGEWTFFDRDGQRVAAGPYRHGLRHGTWRRWETADGEPQIEEYVLGRRLPKLDDLLPVLTEQLLGDDVGRQVDAARRLTFLGEAALPALKQAIATGDVRRCLLAVRTLQQIGPAAKSAADEVAGLAEHAHPRLKCSALAALAELDRDRATDCYHRLLQYATGRDQDLRDRAEAALAGAGPAGLKSLEAALLDETPAVRYAALASIARMLKRRLERPQADPAPVDAPAIREIRATLEAAEENPDKTIRTAAEWMKSMRNPFQYPPVVTGIVG